MADKSAKEKAVKPTPPEVAEAAPAPPAPPPQPASVPAKASCLTFIVLLMAELIVITAIWWNDWSMRPAWYWLVGVTLLVFIIPIVVYRAVALWMFDAGARYPDIAQAWRAGMAELARHGLSLNSLPLFLILGTGSEKLRQNFMSAAATDYLVEGVNEPGSPLYWYANSDGIFLYLNDVSWMNAAITLYEIHAAALRSGRPLPGDLPAPGSAPKPSRYLGTLVPDAGIVGPRTPVRAEMPTDQDAMAGGAQPTAAPAAGLAAVGNQYLGTLTPEQVGASATSPASPPTTAGAVTRSSGPISKRVSNRLSSQESSEQLQRLENVCSLLRRSRHPVCPANGILTLLPFDMLKAGDQDVAELERAIAADLATIYRELQLRCPVTAVVVGMEQEKGFRELIRRIGREGATKQRFGQRFDVRALASEEELRKFTSHVCGTFEDWVYTLFRDDQALSHPGNTSLYALLCKVRRTLKSRLGDILGKGFGSDRQSGRIPLLFSGCYFAATGPKSDRQAFVSGLLSKLYDEQEDIEWTPDALEEDRRRGWLTRIGWLLFAAILVVIIAQLFWSNYSSD
jgi:hypothetical protein